MSHFFVNGCNLEFIFRDQFSDFEVSDITLNSHTCMFNIDKIDDERDIINSLKPSSSHKRKTK